MDQIGMVCMTTSTPHGNTCGWLSAPANSNAAWQENGHNYHLSGINLIAKPAPYSNLLCTSSVVVIGATVGDIINCIDVTTVVDIIDDDVMVVDVVNAVEVGVGVGVRKVEGVVDVKSSVILGIRIISNVELVIMKDVVVDGSITTVLVTDGIVVVVLCPLTRSSVNTSINKPMHLLHCLSIFSDSALLYAVDLCLSVLQCKSNFKVN